MFGRWLRCALAVALAFVLSTAFISFLKNDHPPSHRVQPGNLIVIGMPGLTWSDVNPDTTPTLWDLSHRSAVGNQLVRAISAHSCSNAAWVTLGSGTRTALGYSPPQAPVSGTNTYCPELVTGEYNANTGVYSYPEWPFWAKQARTRNLPSTMGLVASELEKNGQCIAAVGNGAALGAANRDGVVQHYFPSVDLADFNACPVTFVSVPDRSDSTVHSVLEHAPAKTTILVTGLTDDERPESPRAIMVSGPTVKQGLLRSRSTRQPGLVQTTDISAFILERTKDAPVLGEGRPLSIEDHSPESSLKAVINLQRLLRVQHNLLQPFFLGFGITLLAAVLLGFAGMYLARPTGASRWVGRWFSGVAALTGAIIPASYLANLYSWYNSDHVLRALWLTVLAFAVPIAAVALLGPWRRWTPGPAVFLGGTTVVTLAIDAIEGSPLQMTSLLGLQPVYGGRFYGMGNVGYAVFMTSLLFVAAMLAGRYRALKRPRIAMLTAACLCGFGLLIDGVPQWGNDGGGSVAVVLPMAYLIMRARGIKVTLWKLGTGLLAAGLFAIALAWADYSRGPGRRTHVGDVFAGVVDDHQFNPFKRILYTNWSMLTSSPLYWVVPALLLVFALIAAFPDGPGRVLKPQFVRIPMMRQGLIAIVLMWTFGFLANDSGTAVPGLGALQLIPLLVLTGCGLANPKASEAPRAPRDL